MQFSASFSSAFASTNISGCTQTWISISSGVLDILRSKRRGFCHFVDLLHRDAQ